MSRHPTERKERLNDDLSTYFANRPATDIMGLGLDEIVADACMQVADEVEVPTSDPVVVKVAQKKPAVAKTSGMKKGKQLNKTGRLQHTYGAQSLSSKVQSAAVVTGKLLRQVRRYKQVAPLQRVSLQKNELEVRKLMAKQKDLDCALEESAKKSAAAMLKAKRRRENRRNRMMAAPNSRVDAGKSGRPQHKQQQRQCQQFNKSKPARGRGRNRDSGIKHHHMPPPTQSPVPHYSYGPQHYSSAVPHPYSTPAPQHYPPPGVPTTYGFGPPNPPNPYFTGYHGYFMPPPPPPPPPPPYYGQYPGQQFY